MRLSGKSWHPMVAGVWAEIDAEILPHGGALPRRVSERACPRRHVGGSRLSL